MQYRYVAADRSNKKSKGTLTAANKAEAIQGLRQQGLVALALDAIEAGDVSNQSFWTMELTKKDPHKIKIPKKRLLVITNQMAIMMRAGVSLSMAMEVLIETEKDKKLRQILQEMNDDLYVGTPISTSMAKFRAWPEIIVNIVQSGEANGRLDTAFERSALLLEKEINIAAKIKSAMGYPIFLLCLTFLMVMVMSMVVLPAFVGVFEDFGAPLPGITVALMNFSSFVTKYWYLVLALIAALIGGFIALRKYHGGFRFFVDQYTLKIPLIGKVMRQSYIARFCRIMSTLVEAGVDIVMALEISRDVIPNRYMKSQLSEIVAEVRVGVPINQSMAKFPLFDSLLVSMIRVGEESGMLSDTMEKMAVMYEDETDEATKRLTNMIEPAMTIIIAVVVGTVLLSIVIPMFGMYSIIK